LTIVKILLIYKNNKNIKMVETTQNKTESMKAQEMLSLEEDPQKTKKSHLLGLEELIEKVLRLFSEFTKPTAQQYSNFVKAVKALHIPYIAPLLDIRDRVGDTEIRAQLFQ